MYFDESLLSEIRDRNDIVSLVSSYTELKKSGNRYLGLCPFHREKTPSFFVSEEDKLFYCFGCHEGGNIINFVEKINNLDFTEAVRLLAQRANIPIPEEGEKAPEEYRQKQRIYEINKTAAKYFHNNLMSNKKALEYLTGRGLSAKTVKSFGLGYANDSYRDLKSYLLSQGFREFEMVSAGLNLQKERSSFDFFRNRIIFPVIDLRGNVIAFGGRVLDNSLPKYLNTSDTAVFKKRHNLFALNIAKNSAKGYIILAEGYMDVISMHQYGFTNAVASLGTSFCDEHAQLLKRYTKNVVICYDSDEAGRNALKKAAQILIGRGISAKAAVLKGGKDPDEILKKYGAEYFEKLLDSAKPFTEYMLELEKNKHDTETLSGKAEYAEAAAEYLYYASGEVERELYIKKISEDIGVDSSVIRREYEKKFKGRQRAEKSKEELKEKYRSSGESDVDKYKNALKKCEGELINLMIDDNACFKKLKERLSDDFFTVPAYTHAFALIKELKEQSGFSVNMLIDRLDEEERGVLISSKFNEMKYDSAVGAVEVLLKGISQLKSRIAVADSDSAQSLDEQIKKMREQRKK